MAPGLEPRRWAPRWLWLLFACAVSLATLLVKQHFLADVVVGLLVAYGSLRFARAVTSKRLSPGRLHQSS
jgi:membrane-associated phospholipid phosphatase